MVESYAVTRYRPFLGTYETRLVPYTTYRPYYAPGIAYAAYVPAPSCGSCGYSACGSCGYSSWVVRLQFMRFVRLRFVRFGRLRLGGIWSVVGMFVVRRGVFFRSGAFDGRRFKCFADADV